MNFTAISFLLRLNCKIYFRIKVKIFFRHAIVIERCDRRCYAPNNQNQVQSNNKNSRLILLSVFKVNSKDHQ